MMSKRSTRLLEKQQRSASDASSGSEAGLADDHPAETGGDRPGGDDDHGENPWETVAGKRGSGSSSPASSAGQGDGEDSHGGNPRQTEADKSGSGSSSNVSSHDGDRTVIEGSTIDSRVTGGVGNMFAVLDVHDDDDDDGHAEAADKEVAINSGLTAGQPDGRNNEGVEAAPVTNYDNTAQVAAASAEPDLALTAGLLKEAAAEICGRDARIVELLAALSAAETNGQQLRATADDMQVALTQVQMSMAEQKDQADRASRANARATIEATAAQVAASAARGAADSSRRHAAVTRTAAVEHAAVAKAAAEPVTAPAPAAGVVAELRREMASLRALISPPGTPARHVATSQDGGGGGGGPSSSPPSSDNDSDPSSRSPRPRKTPRAATTHAKHSVKMPKYSGDTHAYPTWERKARAYFKFSYKLHTLDKLDDLPATHRAEAENVIVTVLSGRASDIAEETDGDWLSIIDKLHCDYITDMETRQSEAEAALRGVKWPTKRSLPWVQQLKSLEDVLRKRIKAARDFQVNMNFNQLRAIVESIVPEELSSTTNDLANTNGETIDQYGLLTGALHRAARALDRKGKRVTFDSDPDSTSADTTTAADVKAYLSLSVSGSTPKDSCAFCHKQGHTRDACRMLKAQQYLAKRGGGSSALAATEATGPACWNCGERGHLKADCPKPRKPRGGTAAATGGRDQKALSALVDRKVKKALATREARPNGRQGAVKAVIAATNKVPGLPNHIRSTINQLASKEYEEDHSCSTDSDSESDE
jgi:hypothetical protein